MIIDTFPFNKDFNALEIRYEELKNVVDMFVVSESVFTHSGISKELHLQNATGVRNKMGSQLVVLTSRKRVFTKNPRTREMLQRQEITRFLKGLNLKPLDLVIHSDCDEIPRASIVRQVAQSNAEIDALLELDNYANYLNTKDGFWQRGRIQSWNKFRSIQHMRADIYIHNSASNRRHQLPVMRLTDFWSPKRYPLNKFPELIKINTLQVFKNAGWHFNNLIDEESIIEKIESSCHVEWNTPEVRAKAIHNYKNALDIYTGAKHKVISIDETYPRHVVENIDRWSQFIFPTIRK